MIVNHWGRDIRWMTEVEDIVSSSPLNVHQVGIIVAQCLMVLLAVNCASSLQWALGFVPTLGIFMPSLLCE